MRLIVGGRAQGKRAYLETLAGRIADGAAADAAALEAAEGVDRLHLLAARWLAEGKDPSNEALRLAQRHPDFIFVCDEVGCGIVPMDRREREWREAVGRMCCALAARAAVVERVVCGIPLTLKGGKPE